MFHWLVQVHVCNVTVSSVYEDHNLGTPAQVILQVGCSDEEAEQEDVVLGALNLASTLTWVAMDTKITEIFVVSLYIYICTACDVM